MNRTKYIIGIMSMLLSVSCSENITDMILDKEMMPISMSAVYPVTGVTRASDNGFVADDEVGLFIVDYDRDGNPGEPAMQGIRGSNVKFTYDGSLWSASYQLYWADKSTPVDFYGYYPYDRAMNTVTDYAFNISRKQNSDATSTSASGYEKSDLLWAKAENVKPTLEPVNLQYHHLMAGITVMLEKGSGFTDEEWIGFEKTVLVENTILEGTVNLKTGETSVDDDAAKQAITPLAYNGVWRAVTYPQTVEAGKSVVSITVDGQTYSLKKTTDMTYLSGKMHNFTITVDRSSVSSDLVFTLKSEDIVAWLDDPGLHDGLVRQYTIVKVNSVGTLQQTMSQMKLDHERIMSLKVEGPINGSDLEFMGRQMNSIQSLNLQKAVIEDGCIGWFGGHSVLRHVVFPEKGLTAIGGQAFARTGLTGSLVIPEGVVTIEGEAFRDCGYLKGSLELPSTLKRIEGGAFAFSGLTGELRLPDGIEYIDPGYYWVFQGCDFEGSLYLPESLTTLPNLGFSKVTGKIVIPKNINEIGENVFSGIGCSSVEFHDGITKIGEGAFRGSQLSGELVLPSNLQVLEAAFLETKISNIIFPDALKVMGDADYNFNGVFSNCSYLMGTIEFARNVSRVPKGCFNNCTGMTGLVLSENVEVIDELAFGNCYSLKSIICENPEPPVVCTDAFRGVPKDNFTVEVPKGSVEKYKNAQGWSDFKRIAEYSSFVCRPAQANALNTAHSETLILNADGDWTVAHCPSWCTLSQTSGNGKTELRLTFKQMDHGIGNRRDSILFRMPNENYTTYCVVSQYDYEHEEDSYTTLQTHSKGRGIDILFLGDGFDGEVISNGSYLNLVKQQVEYFFGLEPYKSHRDYFNVYVGFPLSQEKGVNTMNTYVNNRFGTLYGYDGQICTSNQLITETDEISDYALKYTPLSADRMDKSLIVFVPNSTAYSGNTLYGRNGLPISICPPSERPYPQDSRGVVQHEAGGHGFGKLGDEEIKYSQWAPASVTNDINDKHRYGWYQNLASTSKMNSVPWADFIFDTRYSDFVDIYEGGAEYMRGVFRPEANSCMNYGIPYYNVVSRLSIMRRIFDYAGENFSMDYFYSHDSKEWGDTDTGTRSVIKNGYSYGSSNLHISPKTVDFRRMGTSVRKIRAGLKAKIYNSRIK